MFFRTKFGAEVVQISSLLTYASSRDLCVIGISFHCGSGCYDANAYVEALELAKEVVAMAAAAGIQFRLIDMVRLAPRA